MTFPDLIFVSLENWDAIWRRNQFLCDGILRRFPETKILFVGQPRDLPNALRGRKISSEDAQNIPRGLTFFRPVKLLPNTFDVTRKVNEFLERWQIRRAARGLRNPVLWLNPHSAAHMAGKLGERAVIYDITDDWTLAEMPPQLKSLTERQDSELCRRADAVIVCSQRLFETRSGTTGNLTLIPNGVDAAHYQQNVIPDAETNAWPTPVLGYAGTVHPERVDLTLVEKLAREFSHGTLALVGPLALSDADKARLDALPNVKLPGAVPYADLPRWLAAFDVCLTPHVQSPFTESLNPIKLWEYLALGKPIVSTNVAGFRDFPHLVRLAQTHQEFVDACRDALSETDAERDENRRARQAEAAGHSWERRVAEVVNVIENLTLNTPRQSQILGVGGAA